MYFTVESLIRIFTDKISWMAYNEASFQLKMMLSNKFPCTKFLLLIDHLRKPGKFHATKFSGYTVLTPHDNSVNTTLLEIFKEIFLLIMHSLLKICRCQKFVDISFQKDKMHKNLETFSLKIFEGKSFD